MIAEHQHVSDVEALEEARLEMVALLSAIEDDVVTLSGIDPGSLIAPAATITATDWPTVDDEWRIDVRAADPDYEASVAHAVGLFHLVRKRWVEIASRLCP